MKPSIFTDIKDTPPPRRAVTTPIFGPNKDDKSSKAAEFRKRIDDAIKFANGEPTTTTTATTTKATIQIAVHPVELVKQIHRTSDEILSAMYKSYTARQAACASQGHTTLPEELKASHMLYYDTNTLLLAGLYATAKELVYGKVKPLVDEMTRPDEEPKTPPVPSKEETKEEVPPPKATQVRLM
jgi:hypothetical protein